jgi:hypothetical protein
MSSYLKIREALLERGPEEATGHHCGNSRRGILNAHLFLDTREVLT